MLSAAKDLGIMPQLRFETLRCAQDDECLGQLMRFLPFLLAGLLLSQPINADILVDAWARATPPGATTGAIYGVVQNQSETARVVKAVLFDQAHHVMIHRTVHEDGMARMQHGQLEIPAGESIVLEPGGLHVMLMGLSDRLSQGCEYDFSLSWQNGEVTRHRFRTGSYGQQNAPGDVGDCP